MNSSTIIRLDDRLIHGQVVVGWGSVYSFDRIIVANDEFAASDWEKELLLLAAPTSANADVLTISETAELLPTLHEESSNAIVLLNSPDDLQKLCNAVPSLKKINLGGLHFKPGRSEILRYLFMNQDEISLFKLLMGEGVDFECLDVPGGDPKDLATLI